MTEPEMVDKIHLLPKQVQEHLFLYIDFLFSVYTSRSGEAPAQDFFAEHALTGAGQDFLEKRAADALAHPEKNLPWREARSHIHKKHNLPQ